MEEETKNTAPPISDEIAVLTKDINVTEGFFLENPDPTVLSEGKGKGLDFYDEVDRDPHAGSVLQTRYLGLSGEKWEINPGDDTPAAKEIAEFVTGVLSNCNFKQMKQEILQAILYGFYNAEVMYQVVDGKITIKKFICKHPRRFRFTMDREIRLLTRDNPEKGEEIPDCKIITFSYGDSDNPYGKGLGQKLWWSVWFKKHGIKFWLIFLDKFGMPTGVGKYPSGALDPEKKTLKEAVDAIHSETGIIIPEGMSIDLLEASRGGKVTYESLCEYFDKQMSKAVLGQTLTTEVSGGSLAASQTHDEVRQDIKEADAGLLAETLDQTVIKWVVDYNFATVSAYPTFRFVTEKEQVLKELAERDEVLVNQIGVEVDPNYFYDTYNLPRPEGGAKITKPQSQPQPQSQPKQFSEEPDQPDPIDILTSKVLDQGSTDKLLQPIKKLLGQAKDIEEFRDNLLETYAHMDGADLAKAMQQAFVIAEQSGDFDGRPENAL